MSKNIILNVKEKINSCNTSFFPKHTKKTAPAVFLYYSSWGKRFKNLKVIGRDINEVIKYAMGWES